MKLCDRGLNFLQIYDDLGDVRVCSWTRDGYLGSLLDYDFSELFHGEQARKVRERLSKDDYCGCNRDDCPYLACGTINDHKVEIAEAPQCPEWLYLAYENVCNYNCKTCNIHERMLAADKTELEKRYDIIEEKIKPILPHVKRISANGQGEIFASKRILKIIKEWKPLAPKEECSVAIETNGSLFDEKHFAEIKEVGQYHLMVAVTVMSFDEKIYQELSGTKLPISQIENNLRYIKGLREKGIINELEIATVVQERNFRELPEFTRRCIDEFGADIVRLRSFVPWGKQPIEVEWFTDVINPYHPYHEEYKKVMQDPIFNHPKVKDWSGGIGTLLGEHPYKKRLDLALQKNEAVCQLIKQRESVKKHIDEISSEKYLVIYGAGEVGRALIDLGCVSHEADNVTIVDSYTQETEYQGIRIQRICDISQEMWDNTVAINTVMGERVEIKNNLIKEGCKEFYHINDFLCD